MTSRHLRFYGKETRRSPALAFFLFIAGNKTEIENKAITMYVDNIIERFQKNKTQKEH